MVRAFLFPTVRAFIVAGGRKPMVRPAHVTPRRRGFSLWHRHCGYSSQRGRRPFGAAGAQQSFWCAADRIVRRWRTVMREPF